jgi:hypothetical protein
MHPESAQDSAGSSGVGHGPAASGKGKGSSDFAYGAPPDWSGAAPPAPRQPRHGEPSQLASGSTSPPQAQKWLGRTARGMGPGGHAYSYRSEREAVEAALSQMHARTKREGREMLTFIVERGGKYRYLEPRVTGGKHSELLGALPWLEEAAAEEARSGGRIVAWAHTHTSEEWFSEEDARFTRATQLTGYLATPSGRLGIQSPGRFTVIERVLGRVRSPPRGLVSRNAAPVLWP